jgi:hypothetical protein
MIREHEKKKKEHENRNVEVKKEETKLNNAIHNQSNLDYRFG